MGVYSKLDGRVTMDPAAFARFCETPSIDWCAAADNQLPPNSSGQITVDADSGNVMLEADRQLLRNQRLLRDLQKAAQAGKVDGAFMSSCTDGGICLEAVVIRNNETWVGHSNCLNSPVDIGPAATRRLELGGGRHIDTVQRVDGIGTQYRVARHAPLEICDCAGYDEAIGEAVCRNEEARITDDGGPVVDIATLMPSRATGKLEQALLAASGAANALGRLAVGKLAWNATGHGQHTMYRRWLETFPAATGNRAVTYVPDLFRYDGGDDDGVGKKLNFRPVCANTGGTERGLCPAFLVCGPDVTGAVLVPAHVDNTSLAGAAKLAADGADPADAVAIIAAITHPDRK